jgi:hypothetical protein
VVFDDFNIWVFALVEEAYCAVARLALLLCCHFGLGLVLDVFASAWVEWSEGEDEGKGRSETTKDVKANLVGYFEWRCDLFPLYPTYYFATSFGGGMSSVDITSCEKVAAEN